MVSAIHICHWPEIDGDYLLCELLVHRTYRDDVPTAHWLVARFAKLYSSLPKHQRTPFLCDDGIVYTALWAAHDIFLLAVSCRNSNAMLVIALLQYMHLIMEQFFAQNHATDALGAFTRDAVLDNNAFVLELLDECVDFGVAQITEYNILKEYIKMHIHVGAEDPRVGMESDSNSSSDSGPDSALARADTRSFRAKTALAKKSKHALAKELVVTSTHNQAVRTDLDKAATDNLINSSIVRTQVLAINWRLKGIFYSKNEIYIDIVETCDFAYDLETATVNVNQILGACMVRSYLSGMPTCKLGLNEQRLSQVEYDGEKSDLEPNQLCQDELEQEEDHEEEGEGEHLEHEGHALGERGEGEEEGKSPKSQNHKKNNLRKLKHKVPLTNIQFHLCVELSTIYKSNLIQFTPPDDRFQLFSFRVEQQRHKQMSPLLLVDPRYRILREQSRLQIMCTVTTNFRTKLHCRKLVVRIPLHHSLFQLENADQDSFRFRCELGEVRFRVDTSEMLWAIADLPGSKRTVRMMADVHLGNVQHSLAAIPTIFKGAFHGKGRINSKQDPDASNYQDSKEKAYASPGTDASPQSSGASLVTNDALDELDKFYKVNGATLSLFAELQRRVGANINDVCLEFEIPVLAYSGLRVTYIRVVEDTMNYTCFPWVRYLTQARSNDDAQSGQSQYRFRLGPSNFSVV